jgi:hypothetical protein
MRRLAFLIVLAVPGLAFAAGPSVLDFTTGAPKELADRTLGIARDLFVFSFVLALLLELFGRSPTAIRDYAGCVTRALVVFLLLAFYHPVFGAVINVTQGVAERVTPKGAWFQFSHESRQYLGKLYDQKSPADDAAAKDAASDPSLADPHLSGSIVGGFIFQSFVSIIVLLGLAVFGVIALLAKILCGVFFVLGPLAIVCSIPRFSDLGTRWFRQFVTFASWPIFSGLLLALTLATGVKGLYASGALGSIIAALVMVGMGLATPIMASAVIGGSLKDVAAQGIGVMKGHARSAVRGADAGHRALGGGSRVPGAPAQGAGGFRQRGSRPSGPGSPPASNPPKP